MYQRNALYRPRLSKFFFFPAVFSIRLFSTTVYIQHSRENSECLINYFANIIERICASVNGKRRVMQSGCKIKSASQTVSFAKGTICNAIKMKILTTTLMLEQQQQHAWMVRRIWLRNEHFQSFHQSARMRKIVWQGTLSNISLFYRLSYIHATHIKMGKRKIYKNLLCVHIEDLAWEKYLRYYVYARVDANYMQRTRVHNIFRRDYMKRYCERFYKMVRLHLLLVHDDAERFLRSCSTRRYAI